MPDSFLRIQHYVLGFMFDPTRERILLIRKNRPRWQAGKLNGIGGKVEPGESPVSAMVREFTEETGLQTQPSEWSHFAVLEGQDFRVWCFQAASEQMIQARTLTDEEVVLMPAALDFIARHGQTNLATLVAHAQDPDAAWLTLSYRELDSTRRAEHGDPASPVV